MRRGFYVFVFVMIALVVFGDCSNVMASEFAGITRDETALGLTPTTQNQGMGGASIGLPSLNSMNPAALGLVERDLDYDLSTTWSWSNSKKAGNISNYRMDLTIPFLFGTTSRLMGQHWGTINTNEIEGGMDFDADSTTIGLHLGVPLIEDTWAIGLGAYPYEVAHVDFYNPATGDRLFGGKAHSQLGSTQIGTMVKLPWNLTLGAQYIYIIDELKSDIEVPGGEDLEDGDNFYIHYETFGASWKPIEMLTLAIDMWTGEIEGASVVPGKNFDKDIERVNFGAELTPLPFLSVSAGSNNGSPTAGFTVDVMDIAKISYAYVHEAYNDKADTFGETRLHSFSASLAF